MRQDALTQLPLCPSAALKLSPVSSVLIHRPSAAVFFRHAADNRRRKRNQWSVFGARPVEARVSKAQSVERSWWRGDFFWLKKSFVASVSDSKAAFTPNREPAGLFSNNYTARHVAKLAEFAWFSDTAWCNPKAAASGNGEVNGKSRYRLCQQPLHLDCRGSHWK